MCPTLTLVVMLVAILTALGQPADVPQPTQGHQVGDPSYGISIIFPLSAIQCEPVLIYYNNSRSDKVYVYFNTPDDGLVLLNLYFHPGVGYLDWICNIPSGYSFSACILNFDCQYYTVEPGASSARLGNITTSYSDADYFTDFQSYTQHSPFGDSSLSTEYQISTIAFPTSSFPTITANPNLAVSSTTTTTSTSSSTLLTPTVASSSSPPVASSAFPHKFNKAVITGGAVGGVAFVILTLTITFVLLQKRRNSHSHPTIGPPTVESELKPQTAVPDTRWSNHVPTRPALPKHDNSLPHHRPTSDSRNLGADVAPVGVPQLTTAQRLALVASMHPSASTNRQLFKR